MARLHPFSAYRPALLRRALAGLCAALCLCSAGAVPAEPAAAPPSLPVIRIGVQTSLDPAFFTGTFGPTMAALRRRHPDRKFQTEFLALDEFETAIRERRISFFMAESGFFAFAEDRFGARDLAVRTSSRGSDPSHTVSSAVFVRQDSTAKSIEDLRGRTIAAESRYSFGGWTVLRGMIAARGSDPDRFFSDVIFTQSEFPDVASIVLAGGADAGVLKSCEIERLMESHALPEGSLRILEPQPGTALRCLRSGPLYPDIVAASLPHARPEDVRDMTVTLLSMPPSREGDAWGMSPDFGEVDRLFRSLRAGPYSYLKEFNWPAFWESYQEAAVLALGLLALLILHVLRTNRLVALRTAQLREALARERRLESEARESRQRISQMERAGIVSQLSGMLAHEVRQPLYALTNYVGGLRMYAERRYGNDPVVMQAAEAAGAEAARLSEIIERVRGYARGKTARREVLSAAACAEAALRTFSHSTTADGITAKCLAGPEARFEGDPLEIELALVNFLRNGAGAMAEGFRELPLELGWRIEKDLLCFEVRDHGPKLSEDALRRMREPLSSEKPDGLGLGLSLCRSIAERHGGRIAFEMHERGLSAFLILPLMSSKEPS